MRSMRTTLLAGLLAAVVGLWPAVAGATPTYRREVTVDWAQVQGELKDFAVLVSLSGDAALAAHARGDGGDVRFVTGGGVQLAHEIESYDAATGHMQAWVRLPELSSSSDTRFWMTYGDANPAAASGPTGVWDSHYRGVYHFGGNALDSTANQMDATSHGGVSLGEQGLVGSAAGFDGVNDRLRIADFLPSDQGTISMWIQADSAGWRQRLLGANDSFEATLVNGRPSNHFFAAGSDVLTSQSAVQLEQWQYVAFTYDSDSHEAEVFLNGLLSAAGMTADDDAGGPLTLSIGGRTGMSQEDYRGLIDELRISDTVRSSDWILATMLNQSSPGSFARVGAEQVVPEPATLAILCAGGAALLGRRRRRRQRAVQT